MAYWKTVSFLDRNDAESARDLQQRRFLAIGHGESSGAQNFVLSHFSSVGEYPLYIESRRNGCLVTIKSETGQIRKVLLSGMQFVYSFRTTRRKSLNEWNRWQSLKKQWAQEEEARRRKAGGLFA